MGMVVRSNLMAVNAQRQLGMNTSQVAKALEKLSSGYRINRAGDDASGLAISEKMKAQIRGLDAASLNSQDGISVVQTAEGALTEVHNMLNRMTELATRAANGINNDQNRQSLQDEVKELQAEIDRISQATNFNGINLLDGSMGGGAAGNVTVGKPADAEQITFTDGAAGTKSKAVFDFAGLEVSGSGKLDITVGNKTYTIDVEEGDDAEKIAEKFVDAFNKDPIKGNTAGDYVASTATNNKTQITLEATNVGTPDNDIKTALSGKNFVVAPHKADGAKAAAGQTDMKKGDKIEFDLSQLTNPNNNEKVKFGNKEFKFTTTGGNDVKIETDVKDTIKNLADKMKADTDINKNFDVEVKDGKITLTAKNDVAAADVPGFEAGSTWAGAQNVTGTVTPADADKGNGLVLQIGDTAADFNQLTVSIEDMSAAGIGVDKIDISSRKGAQDAIDVIRSAIDKVSAQRATLGATQNRLEYTINNLDTASENIQAANSRIRDTDMAKMMMEYTKTNVITQSAQAMLAQANQQPQSILQLLQ